MNQSLEGVRIICITTEERDFAIEVLRKRAKDAGVSDGIAGGNVSNVYKVPVQFYSKGNRLAGFDNYPIRPNKETTYPDWPAVSLKRQPEYLVAEPPAPPFITAHGRRYKLIEE